MKVVKLNDVEILTNLIKERDVYQDWTDKWEECNKKVDDYIFYIKRSAEEIQNERI